MKVFDCFIFFNELDLLELRLNLLNNFVDYFVIVESAITFQGEEKDFFFEKNKKRFSKFENKIIHFKVDKYKIDFVKLPYFLNPINKDQQVINKIYKFLDDCSHFDKEKETWWCNDFFQRECIWRAIAEANPNIGDLILLSDVDEIPNPEIILTAKRKIIYDEVFYFQQHEFCYYLNYYHSSNWIGTSCFLFSELAVTSMNAVRAVAKSPSVDSLQIISNAGWHFTSMGSVAAIKNKITSWSHKEFNNAATLNNIEYNVKHGYDIFRRPGFGKLECISISSNILPAYLVNNIDLFKNLIGPDIERENIFQRLYFDSYFYILSKVNGISRRVNNLKLKLRAGS